MMERPSVEDHFESVIAKMPEYLRELKNCELTRKNNSGHFFPDISKNKRGIYVFYENDEPIYVGRSDRLRDRLHEHGRASSDHNSASLAFNIARLNYRSEKIRTETDDSSRKELGEDPEFQCLFIEAKQRVRNMGIRVVEIQDAIEQTIFEVYAHMKLDTDPQFNSFENH